MVKEGDQSNFDMGEFDLMFGERNLTVKYPNRTQSIYDVASIGDDRMILQKGDQKIMLVQNALAYLKHTVAAGFTFGADSGSPDAQGEGMKSDTTQDLVMWRCQNWGGNQTCSFGNKSHQMPP